ncbi:hypothetical protein [Nocardia sp. NPDC049707]|uniref:hypothetical protein n=1 Tax=Nocardia sp. NPDC049707 TaxID=3154735 RepID=UPI00343CC457
MPIRAALAHHQIHCTRKKRSMSTQIDERVASIGQLEYSVECDVCQKAAHFFADGHGCGHAYMCGKCLADHQDYVDWILELDGVIGCFACPREFNKYDEFVQVMPL